MMPPGEQTGARCPGCGGAAAAVVNTRPVKQGQRRRRQCGQCGRRWSTLEVDAALFNQLIKAAQAQGWQAPPA